MDSISELEKFDYMGVREQDDILCQLGYDESIYFSGIITKFNKHDWKQDRLFVVTNLSIYNIKGSKIQRQIPIKDIGKIITSFSLYLRINI